MTEQEVIKDTLVRLELKLAKEQKVYGITTIILSALDVICGLLCIIFTSIQITALIVSIASGTVICSRAVQVLKTKNLINTIRTLNGLSSAYIVCRMKKGEYMKSFIQAIKNNPLTLLFAIIGGVVMGFGGYKLSALYLVAPNYAYVLIGVGCCLLTVLFVVILGWDKAKAAILRTAKKTLTSENYETLVEMVGTMEQKQAEDAEKQAKEKQKALELEQAKATVEAYEKAKKLLDDAAVENANVVAENTSVEG